MTAVLFGVKRLRPTLGGFALGTAALLTQMMAGDVATPFGSVLTWVWLVVNVSICLWISRLGLDAKKT